MPVLAYTIQFIADTLDILQRYQSDVCSIDLSTQLSIENGKLNLIPNPPTEKDGGRVDIIKRTHIVEKFFVIFSMKRLWLK